MHARSSDTNNLIKLVADKNVILLTHTKSCYWTRISVDQSQVSNENVCYLEHKDTLPPYEKLLCIGQSFSTLIDNKIPVLFLNASNKILNVKEGTLIALAEKIKDDDLEEVPCKLSKLSLTDSSNVLTVQEKSEREKLTLIKEALAPCVATFLYLSKGNLEEN